MWHHDGMGWWMVVGSIWMVAFWGLVIALVVWGIRQLTERGGSSSGTSEKRNPLDIAKERYAKGEILKEEFDQIKKDLS
jgi:putative membrane protein